MDDVREITPEELEGVLPALVTLPGTGRAAVRRQVSGFLTYLRQTDLRWRGFRRGDAATPSGLLLALLLPGRTAIVMTPSPEVRGIEAASQTRVIEAGLEALRHEGLHYAQVLLEPDYIIGI